MASSGFPLICGISSTTSRDLAQNPLDLSHEIDQIWLYACLYAYFQYCSHRLWLGRAGRSGGLHFHWLADWQQRLSGLLQGKALREKARLRIASRRQAISIPAITRVYPDLHPFARPLSEVKDLGSQIPQNQALFGVFFQNG